MRGLWIGLLAAGMTSSAHAHDFWLQPLHFNLAANSSTPFTILVGHGRDRSRWSGRVDRVVMMQGVGPAGAVDQKPGLHPAPDRDGDLGFAGAGTYVVAFQSTPAMSDLPALRYNDYARAEGLTPALTQRARMHTTDTPGRETYSRRAKALVQVGEPRGPQPWVTRPVGLSLEIVPEKSPYALAPKEDLPVRILFDGKPLAGALVKLTNLEFDARPIAMKLSDAEGRASFSVPRTGTWLVNVIWTAPIKGNPKADFDTTFSSLTFGYGGSAGQH